MENLKKPLPTNYAGLEMTDFGFPKVHAYTDEICHCTLCGNCESQCECWCDPAIEYIFNNRNATNNDAFFESGEDYFADHDYTAQIYCN